MRAARRDQGLVGRGNLRVICVVSFTHAGYAAYGLSRDEDYRYPLATDIVESTR